MRAVELGVEPDDLADLGGRHDRPEWVAAASVLREYDEVTALSAPGAFDPAWVLGAAADHLEDDPDSLDRLRARLRLVVVDDAQELTPPPCACCARSSATGRRARPPRRPGRGHPDLPRGRPPPLRHRVGRRPDHRAAHRTPLRGDGAGRREPRRRPHRRGRGRPSPPPRPGSRRRRRRRPPAPHRRAGGRLRRRAAPARPPPGRPPVVADGRRRPRRLAHRDAAARAPGAGVPVGTAARRPAGPRRTRCPSLPHPDAHRPRRHGRRGAPRPRRRRRPAHLAARWRRPRAAPPAAPGPPACRARLGGGRPSDELLAEAVLDPAALDRVGPESAPARRVGRVLRAATGALAEGAGIEEVLWRMWSASGLADPWREAALGGGAAGRRADRDLDAVLGLFDAAGRYTDRLPGSAPSSFLEHLLGQDVAGDSLVGPGAGGRVRRPPHRRRVGRPRVGPRRGRRRPGGRVARPAAAGLAPRVGRARRRRHRARRRRPRRPGPGPPRRDPALPRRADPGPHPRASSLPCAARRTSPRRTSTSSTRSSGRVRSPTSPVR